MPDKIFLRMILISFLFIVSTLQGGETYIENESIEPLTPSAELFSDFEEPVTHGEHPDERFDKSLRRIILNRISGLFSPEVTVFVISMIPIFELRGAIPVGINHFGLNPFLVFFISIAGNMVPVFFILLFLDGFTKICYKIPILSRLLDFIFNRTRSKSKAVEKYEELGLVAFVAIPLPITGAWTGSLAAYLFGLMFWKSVFFIFCGVIIAGIVVTTLSLMGWLGAIIALTVLLLLFLRKAWNMMNNKKSTGRSGELR